MLKEVGCIDCYVAWLQSVHGAYKPFGARTACLDYVFAYLAVESLALVPHRWAMFPEVEFRLAFIYIGQVVPVEECYRTVIHHWHGQLVCLGVLHSAVEVARSVVGRSAEETGEGKHGVVLGIRHLLVAAYALLCHEVGVGAAPSRRAILVVNIYHYVVVGTLAHGTMQPCGPLLRTYLNKAELDAADAPLVI